MEWLIIKILCASLVGLSLFFISKSVLCSPVKLFGFKTIFLIFAFIAITVLMYKVDFSPLAPLIIYLSMIVIYKFIFNMKLSKAIITMVIVYIIYFVADIIVWVVLSSLFGATQVRENSYIFLMSNIAVCLLAIGISYVPFIKNKVMLFIGHMHNNKYYNKGLFFLLIFIVLSLILYNVSVASTLSKSYFVDIIIMLFFFVIAYIYIDEKLKQEKLNDEYEKLIEYVSTIEEWIDEEQLNNHEYKNQLAVIRNMAVKNKKVVKYIDDILKDNIYAEDFWANEIKHLPAGGIKGLLYYKLLSTKKNKINVCLSIDKTVKNLFHNIDDLELKNISRVLGIFLDNAIEASKDSNKKIMSVEIYPKVNDIMLVISNSYSNNIDFKNINNKGYTTKGKGRGKGLYFASKIIKKSSVLSSERSLINEYYVQKLIISNKKRDL